MKTPLIVMLSLVAALGALQGLLAAEEIQIASAKDVNLQTAGAQTAPLDVAKHADPMIPLSHSQRQELLGEFKGLVHMGLRKVAFERWEGKDMADCSRPDNDEERWTYRCEIITGQGNGYYYFYPSESRRYSTLQQLDIRVDASDEKLLDDFRKPVQELFGRGSLVEKAAVSGAPTGPIRHWNTGDDVADLFIDRSVRPEGSVRFVWTRAPLVGGARASLPTAKPQSE